MINKEGGVPIPKTYEHESINWFKFTFMLAIFYSAICALFLAVFLLGTGDDTISTYWSYFVLAVTILVVSIMMHLGG